MAITQFAIAGENPQIPELDKRLHEISELNYWHKLLHYKSSWLGYGYKSEISDPAFFLSGKGHQDAYEELLATIDAFKNDESNVCRFPARYYWLSRQFGDSIGLAPGRLQNCSELQEWYRTINPGSATLIFPAAYLNGPSSMFGHTLLRIEPADERKDLPLITYAVNYAANVTRSDNDVAFAFKGILGGYPGVMAIVPYHQKIKEYGEIESRDIWEYQLNLNKQEIDQMLRHAWELKELRSAYYFFDLNCSYLILNLIEVGRENINLTDPFRFKVIPIDTVRAVVEAGLVANTEYRAAAATQLTQHYELLDDSQRLQVKRILDIQPDLSQQETLKQNPVDYARILEITYDTYRYRAFQTPSERDSNAGYNLKLLQARSEITEKNIWPAVSVPASKPEEGHKSARIAEAYQKKMIGDQDENLLVIKLRPAYHDLLDPVKGFPLGAQINFLDFTFTYNTDSHDADLEKLTIIDILSLTPVHDLFDQLSWRVDFGYEKRAFLNQETHVLQVHPGFGKTRNFWGNNLGYILMDSTLEYSDDYRTNYALAIGAQAGVLLASNNYSGTFEVSSSRFFAGESGTRFRSSLGLARHVQSYLSLRLETSREKLYDQYINTCLVSLNWYF